MAISSKASSGCSSAQACRVSAPLATSATTVTSGWAASSERRRSRASGSSSAISTFIPSPVLHAPVCQSWAPRPRSAFETLLQPLAECMDLLGADLVCHRIAVPFQVEPQLLEHLHAVLGHLHGNHRIGAAMGHEQRLGV